MARERQLAEEAATAGASRGWRGEAMVGASSSRQDGRPTAAAGGQEGRPPRARPTAEGPTDKHGRPARNPVVDGNAHNDVAAKYAHAPSYVCVHRHGRHRDAQEESPQLHLLAHVEQCCTSPRRAELLWQDPAQVDALLQLLRVPSDACEADVGRALRAAVSLLRALHHRADAVEVLSAQVTRAVHALCDVQPSTAAAVLTKLADAEAECAGVVSTSGVVGFGSTAALYAGALACTDAGVRAAAARALAQLLQRAHTLALLPHGEAHRALVALQAVQQADVVATLCKVVRVVVAAVCSSESRQQMGCMCHHWVDGHCAAYYFINNTQACHY